MYVCIDIYIYIYIYISEFPNFETRGSSPRHLSETVICLFKVVLSVVVLPLYVSCIVLV